MFSIVLWLYFIEDPAPVDNMTVLAVVLSFVFVFILGAIVLAYCCKYPTQRSTIVYTV